jgi:hypothetical protein
MEGQTWSLVDLEVLVAVLEIKQLAVPHHRDKDMQVVQVRQGQLYLTMVLVVVVVLED